MKTETDPLAVREDRPGRELYDTLHEGLPAHLQSSIEQWLELVKPKYNHDAASEHSWHIWLTEIERRARIDLRTGGYASHRHELLVQLMSKDGELALRVIDVLLSRLDDDTFASILKYLLSTGGSAWTVWMETPYRLVRAVNPELQNLAERLVSTQSSPSGHLAASWHAAYGQNPNGQSAYNSAIKAIEAALWALVEPNNQIATLGTMLTEIRKTTRFNTIFTAASGGEPLDDFARSLGLLWRSQYRHGTGDGARTENTLEQGRAAVLLATVVVQWVNDGVVTSKR